LDVLHLYGYYFVIAVSACVILGLQSLIQMHFHYLIGKILSQWLLASWLREFIFSGSASKGIVIAYV
jgi:hypothetical protein